jgi:Uma2 family endonuclease
LRLNGLTQFHNAGRFIVSVYSPIVLADSEPEPDFSLTRFRADFYASGKPRPHDVFLVVEIADESLAFDRNVKGPLYAENGIAEFWIVNLNDDTLRVYRSPQPDGTYASVEQFTRGAALTIAALPGVSVAVADILP